MGSAILQIKRDPSGLTRHRRGDAVPLGILRITVARGGGPIAVQGQVARARAQNRRCIAAMGIAGAGSDTHFCITFRFTNEVSLSRFLYTKHTS